MSDLPAATRKPRGSYAPLICLNCRSRKIKCVLPDHLDIEPSAVPQPSGSACQRCHNLSLDCVVQRTILGRPAAKRKRVLGLSEQTPVSKPVESTHALDSTQVTGYLLSGAPDDNPEARQAARKKVNEREMFEALLSPSRLMAAHLARDKKFGYDVVPTLAQRPVSLTKLVSNGMAALLDESLVWHRFYFPATPNLMSLRLDLVDLIDSYGTSSTHLLFALLCLIALETPACRLRDDRQLRLDLKAAVSYYSQQVMYTLPNHQHTLLSLVLIFHYKPAAAAPTQNSTAAAVRGDLYIALARRVAERLGLNRMDATLQTHMKAGIHQDIGDLETSITGALLWCQLLVEEAFLDGYITKPDAIMQQIILDISTTLNIAERLLHVYVPSVPIRYSLYEIRLSNMIMNSILHIKQNWRDISRLTEIVDAHEAAFDVHQRIFVDAIRCDANDDAAAETAVAVRLATMDLHDKRGAMSTVAMFYGLMARLKESSITTGDEIQPHEAVQVGDQVIDALKTLRIGKALQMTEFLARFGDARDNRLERILSDFATLADEMMLDEIPWLPAPRSSGLILLLHCRLLVENNAHRMKGWGGLHPDFENQARCIDRCAYSLEAMTTKAGRTVDDAFASGCVYAASAKLLRCLHTIMMGWKARLEPEQAQSAPGPVDTASTTNVNTGNDASSWTYDSLDDFDFDELFGQWNNWPNADGLDFSQFLPNDMEWS